jgi:hypothetical protein
MNARSCPHSFRTETDQEGRQRVDFTRLPRRPGMAANCALRPAGIDVNGHKDVFVVITNSRERRRSRENYAKVIVRFAPPSKNSTRESARRVLQILRRL